MTDQEQMAWDAWAAGFIDGEGCIILHRINPRKFSLRISVGNTDIRPLHRLQQMYGGSVRWDRHPRGRPFWVWKTVSLNAAKCLLRVMPWLVVKHEQAELAIRSRQYMRRGRKTEVELENLEWLKREISRLKTQPMSPPETPGQRTPSEEGQEKFTWPI